MSLHLNKFDTRQDAGRLLAQELNGFADHKNIIILALPRGGALVGYELAKRLRLPMDLFLVRKLTVTHPEKSTIGAIAINDTCILNQEIIQNLGISTAEVAAIVDKARENIIHQNQIFRNSQPFASIKGKIAMIVDDGIATGATMKAAVSAAQKMNPESVIIATPVSSHTAHQELASQVDEIYCLKTPEPVYDVGQWYHDYKQPTDADVSQSLKEANQLFG